MTCYKRATSCQFSTVIFKGQLHKLLPQWYKRDNSTATNPDQGRTSLRRAWTGCLGLCATLMKLLDRAHGTAGRASYGICGSAETLSKKYKSNRTALAEGTNLRDGHFYCSTTGID